MTATTTAPATETPPPRPDEATVPPTSPPSPASGTVDDDRDAAAVHAWCDILRKTLGIADTVIERQASDLAAQQTELQRITRINDNLLERIDPRRRNADRLWWGLTTGLLLAYAVIAAGAYPGVVLWSGIGALAGQITLWILRRLRTAERRWDKEHWRWN